MIPSNPVSHKRLEEFDDSFNILNRSNHGNVLVRPHSDDSTMLGINAERLISVSVTVVIALVVNKDLVGDCLVSVQEQFKANFRLTCKLPLAIRQGEQFWYL